jgi:hypothetical protein
MKVEKSPKPRKNVPKPATDYKNHVIAAGNVHYALNTPHKSLKSVTTEILRQARKRSKM